MTSNVTRVDLYEVVYQKVGLSRSESLAMVELVLKEITGSLEKGETVKLSSFGSFFVRKKKAAHGPQPEDRHRGDNIAATHRSVQAVVDLEAADQR